MERKNEKQNFKPVAVVAAVIRRWQGAQLQVLLVRRGPGQSGAGDWEFPGGKVERNESPQEALAREIEEELGLEIQVKEKVGENTFSYPHRAIQLSLYWAEIRGGELRLSEHDAYEWLLPTEIETGKLSAADQPFVKLLF